MVGPSRYRHSTTSNCFENPFALYAVFPGPTFAAVAGVLTESVRLTCVDAPPTIEIRLFPFRLNAKKIYFPAVSPAGTGISVVTDAPLRITHQVGQYTGTAHIDTLSLRSGIYTKKYLRCCAGILNDSGQRHAV